MKMFCDPGLVLVLELNKTAASQVVNLRCPASQNNRVVCRFAYSPV
jgi:hypothetical protein